MPTFAPSYNPRKRYLAALAGLGQSPNLVAGGRYWWAIPSASPRTLTGPGPKMPHVFHLPPQQARIATVAPPTMRSRRRLRGLGQVDVSNLAPSPLDIYSAGAATMSTESPILAQSSAQYQAALAAAAAVQPPSIMGPGPAPAPIGVAYGSIVAPGTSVAFTPSGGQIINVPSPAAAAAPGGASWFSGSTGGLPNAVLLVGIGGIALLALLSSRRR